jgi:hypothetical protein
VAARLAGISYAKLGERETAREVWWAILEQADNELMRRVAQRNLRNLDMEEGEDVLTEAVARYRELTGELPTDWGQLIERGLLRAMPVEPFGGTYLLDTETGKVWSTTHVDRVMAYARDIFAGFVRRIYAEEGRYPASLEEVVERGYAPSPPWQPFGLRIEYDPVTGVLTWDPPWPAAEPETHGEASV